MENTVITIRPTEKESKDISEIKKYYNVGHATKALLRASVDVIALKSEIDKLKGKYRALSDEHVSLVKAVREKKSVDMRIEKIIQTSKH